MTSIMADVATTTPAADGTAQKMRPEKPDQAKYEADLAAAQKEHTANMEKFVCPLSWTSVSLQGPAITLQLEHLLRESRTPLRLASKAQNLEKAHLRTRDGMHWLQNRRRYQSNNGKTRSHDLRNERSTMLLKLN